MKTRMEFGDKGDNELSRAATIRALFTKGRTIEAHTEICLRAGVWTDAENIAAAMAHHRAEVREALRALIDGLPFAGETGKRVDDKPLWKQMDLWKYEDFEYNIQTRMRQTKGDVSVLNRIITVCLQRFGKSPISRLALTEAEDEPVI